MKLGFVLLSNLNRPQIFEQSFTSLVKTNTEGLERTILYLIYHYSWDSYIPYVTELQKTWDVVAIQDFENVSYSLNRFFALGGDKLLEETDATHIGFLVDDFVYNPQWLQELTKLISRHPGAKAWSVYRSAYTRHHRIIGSDGTDVLMTMHDCLGTMTREEWKEYDASSRHDFSAPHWFGGGCTIDINHAFTREGERWATSRDYMNNLGMHNVYDHAIDFVGE